MGLQRARVLVLSVCLSVVVNILNIFFISEGRKTIGDQDLTSLHLLYSFEVCCPGVFNSKSVLGMKGNNIYRNTSQKE